MCRNWIKTKDQPSPATSLTAAAAGLCLLLLSPGCSVDPPQSEGRACIDDTACGPGTHCDLKTQKCVKDHSGNDDSGPRDVEGNPDLLKPDTREHDSFKAPDGGCPKGYTRCGNICANLLSDKLNCGKCKEQCPPSEADKCVNGMCICSGAGKVCGSGLDCVAGDCRCKKGGSCTGCCDGDTCRFVGSMQSVTKCGKGGEDCRICKTNQCASTACTMGTCTNTWQSGKSCNDGKPCSHTDTCSSTGLCAGTSYSCADNASCTKDACTGNTPPYQCNYTVSSGYCAIKSGSTTVCYTNGKAHPKDKCLKCDTAKSKTTWSPVSGCSTSATVSTMVKSHSFYMLRGVAVDSAGLIYVADTFRHCVKRINPTSSVVTTMGGSCGTKGFKNGTGSAALFNMPTGIDVDTKGNIFVADAGNHAIRKIAAGTGATSTLTGTGQSGYVNGSLSQAKFYNPCGLALDAYGNIYVGDTYNHRIRKITSTTVSFYAGSSVGFADGSVTTAKFYNPFHVAVGPSNRVFVADYSNNRVRMISAGTVSTIGGNGTKGYKDGGASSSQFAYPRGVAVSATGKVYVADYGNHRIRTIYAGTVGTLAGAGVSGYLDGAATTAKFGYPYGVAVHSSGKIYVADFNNSKLRLVTISGAP